MRWVKRRGDEDIDADAVEEATVDETARDETKTSKPTSARRRVNWRRAIAYGALPAAALLLASAAGFLKYQHDSVVGADPVRESVRAATDGTVALLSYRPDTVQKDLDAARGRLTGTFLDEYTKLTHDVVIPGAQQKQITAVATVPAAASTSATPSRAVVLLFIDQTVTVGKDAQTNTASTVRVTLDKIDNRWLISQFDPV
jgi:Mce-associated membrane protein